MQPNELRPLQEPSALTPDELDARVQREFTIVGRRTARVDGLDKATGRAVYTDDLALPGMLHGKILRSPHAHARILSIATSTAEAIEGVHAVITGKDLPEKYCIIPWTRDETALTMELKTSWVRADTLDNKEDYFRIFGYVPNFVESTGTEVPRLMRFNDDTDAQPVELALVGMHVVGTVQHHPEFVWASFEHVDNAPNAPYYYTTNAGETKRTVDPQGSYLFTDSSTDPSDYRSANVECMHVQDGHIVPIMKDGQPVCAGGIVPSSTVRVNPWGAEAGDQAQPAVDNNTLLISNNISVQGWLASDDPRRNYVQIGGLWTAPAQNRGVDAPIPKIGGFGSDAPSYSESDQRGSRQLANATMETYNQDINCFICHSVSTDAPNSFVKHGLSHIFSEIDPLN